MIKFRSIALLIFLALIMVPVFSDVYGHSMFNSAESTLGGYRVQVATLPEFPEIGETSQILFRVSDIDFVEVDRFTLGARIFYTLKLIRINVSDVTVVEMFVQFWWICRIALIAKVFPKPMCAV